MAYEDTTRDFNLTSTGKGHQYRQGLTFPPTDFKRTVSNPLPPLLGREENVKDFYITTNGSAHNYKPRHASLQNDIYKRAPGHWNVKYTEDTITKIQVKPQRESLTMGNQESEMKSQYTGRKTKSMNSTFSNDIQPPMYRHHHTNGPLKTLIPSTNKAIQQSGHKYPLQDRGVFDYHGEMYLTTTQKEHRPFTSEELDKYPKKEYGTYWECEGYPKAWGHGSKLNPLPPDSVPREKGPMRDQMCFKTATIIPRIPKPLHVIPNTGMCSEVAGNVKDIPHHKRKELFECPVPKPWDLSGTSSDGIFTVPKMYKTEYHTIGSGKLQLV